MCPPVHVSALDGQRLVGTVTCTAFHGGFGTGAHGGVVALLMNELMGTLANADPDTVRLAAFIRVDYRSSAPLDTALEARAAVDRTEGRKQYVRATLRAGDLLVAEGEGLFLGPRTPPRTDP
jgi:acyl-coenzyme A thioesterase PaaI-like protein